jgi:hypothetical protein
VRAKAAEVLVISASSNWRERQTRCATQNEYIVGLDAF